jgi:transketolase
MLRKSREYIATKAYNLRHASLLMTTIAGSGHPTSCLSAADLVAALFFYAMHFDPHDIHNPNNDRFILSKGHAAPLLYAVWKELGELSESELLGYRSLGSDLEGHPTPRFRYAEAATGSLGMGLSIGAGMALAGRLDGYDYRTYVLLGDAEVAEGSVWEAAEIAAFYKLDSLIALLDCNRLGQSTESLHNHHVERYADKFRAFGWHALIIDGHDISQIMHACDKAREHRGTPTIIVAKTIKGYGVASVENREGFHGKAFSKEQLNEVFAELERHFPLCLPLRQGYAGQAGRTDDTWRPTLPNIVQPQELRTPTPMPEPRYSLSEMIAPRKAYGQALAALGSVNRAVVALDADVKNSTFADIFEHAHSGRFFQCFVAEQNMVSMGVGLARRGKIPFISTFAAFFTRAYDQIRMAAIGSSPLRLVGSHAGISIGADGPSQMGLEDIALMRALPHSVVLYPSDAVSSWKLVELMASYNAGISYLRTTRMEMPVIYQATENFSLGGCKVIRSSATDQVCIIAAGVTLFQALAAHEQLQKQGINSAIIDLYCVKPIDAATIIAVAKKAGGRVITVEDHYLEGGLGQAVMYELRSTDIQINCLAVTKVPHSGTPQELLAWACLDAQAIVNAVKSFF